jgi:hypothetical protein
MVRHASLRAFAIPSVRRGPAHLRSGRQGSADGPTSNVAKGGGGTWSAPDSTMCSGEAPSIETPTRQAYGPRRSPNMSPIGSHFDSGHHSLYLSKMNHQCVELVLAINRARKS